MANHFGKNPSNGGSPPSDNKLTKIINFSFMFFIRVSWEKQFRFKNQKEKHKINLVIEYRIK